MPGWPRRLYVGRTIEHDVEVHLAGRLELSGREVRDGAHTPEAADWLLERLPQPGGYVVVASILADKDADGILARLARAGSTLVATRSTNERALPADALAAAAAPWFDRVETVADPNAALARAHEPRAGACSSRARSISSRISRTLTDMRAMMRPRDRVTVFLFAVFLLVLFVGLSFAAGYLLGRMLL